MCFFFCSVCSCFLACIAMICVLLNPAPSCYESGKLGKEEECRSPKREGFMGK